MFLIHHSKNIIHVPNQKHLRVIDKYYKAPLEVLLPFSRRFLSIGILQYSFFQAGNPISLFFFNKPLCFALYKSQENLSLKQSRYPVTCSPNNWMTSRL
jgi:hypothetical protein